MRNFTPYLHFAGNAEEVMLFYKSVLGGEFSILSRYGDIPGGDKIPPHEQQKLIHVSLKVSDSITIMATDVLDTMEQKLDAGNNFHIVIHTESEEETNQLFEKLSDEGDIEMPPNKTFWGSYFGMCRDKFGIQWMIEFT